MTAPAARRATLDPLLRPRRVAVVGASPKAGTFANQPLVNLRRFGFRGDVYPVNPSHQEVEGLRCYASVTDLPEVPDLAVVVVRPGLAVQTLAQCADIGVRAAVAVASGFAETGEAEGTELQDRMREIAAKSGMRLCGPNTLGVANFNDATVPFVSGNIPSEPITGAIAIVSQSGGCGFTLLNRAWSLGIGVGHLAVAGNEVDVSIPELVSYYLERDDVRTVICYMEAVRDVDGLRRMGELSARLGKPVFVMKTGATAQGRRAAAAHTGALATSDAVCDAALRQWGLRRARTFDTLVAAGALAARFEAPESGRLGVYAQGGGLAVVTADAFASAGLELPALQDPTVQRIKELMPDTTPGNPFDSGGQFLSSGVDLLAAGLTAFVDDKNIDAVVYCLMPVVGQRIGVYAEGIARVASARSKPSVVLQYRAGQLTERASEIFHDASLLALDPPEAGIEAIKLWLGTRDASGAADEKITRRSPAAGEQARALVASWRHRGLHAVAEHEAVGLLELYGVPTARQVLVRDAAAATAAVAGLQAPYVVKAASPELPHRSDFGGVVLDIPDAAGVADAFAAVVGRARGAHPDVTLEGATVAEMAPPGTELIAAVSLDPTFGPTVMVGLGGIWAETFQDTAFRLPPFGATSATEMLRSLRGADLLFGKRGREAVDIDALADVLVRLGELALDVGDAVRAVEVNPLIAYPDGLRVVDALVELPR